LEWLSSGHAVGPNYNGNLERGSGSLAKELAAWDENDLLLPSLELFVEPFKSEKWNCRGNDGQHG
jgi:hypothetical protein